MKTNVPISCEDSYFALWIHLSWSGVVPSDQWQVICLRNADSSCGNGARGGQSADGAWVQAVIVAVGNTRAARPMSWWMIFLHRRSGGCCRTASAGDTSPSSPESPDRSYFADLGDGHRTLEAVLSRLDEAGQAGADLACLPEVCVDQPPEPIPGPTYEKIAEKAAQYKMLVVGNLREAEGDKWYVTSFLCDRQGRLIGKYRKSHCCPMN